MSCELSVVILNVLTKLKSEPTRPASVGKFNSKRFVSVSFFCAFFHTIVIFFLKTLVLCAGRVVDDVYPAANAFATNRYFGEVLVDIVFKPTDTSPVLWQAVFGIDIISSLT